MSMPWLLTLSWLVACRPDPAKGDDTHPSDTADPDSDSSGDSGSTDSDSAPDSDSDADSDSDSAAGGDPSRDDDGDGYTVGQGDCDDADPSVYPPPDVLGEEEDVSACDARVLVERSERLGELYGGLLGSVLSGAGDVDGDGTPDMLLAAPQAPDGALEVVGAVYLVPGDAGGAPDLSAEAATLIGEGEQHEAGSSLAPVGDWDGDGYDEFAVGAPNWGYDADEDSGVGQAYVHFGPVTGEIDLGDADARVYGLSVYDRVGLALGRTGDWDGDGLDELLIGSDAFRGTTGVEGPTRLLPGGSAGAMGFSALETEIVPDDLGFNDFANGDLDGDGVDDLAIASENSGPAGAGSTGAVYVQSGPLSGSFSVTDADATLEGADGSNGFGTDVAVLEADGDGTADLAVIEKSYDGCGDACGAAWIFYGPVSSGVGETLADVAFLGTSELDRFGTSLASPGDVDGDGWDDLAIGQALDAPWHGAEYAGATYLYLGPFGGSLGPADAADAKLGSPDDETGAATLVGAPGDVNGDGLPDLLVGNKGLSTVDYGEGAVWLLTAP